MLHRPAPDITENDVTPRRLLLNRRAFLALGAGSLAALPALAAPLSGVATGSPFDTDEKPTPQKDATTYNNFYELGFEKSDPAENAASFPPLRPWKVEVTGECGKPATVDLDDLIRPSKLEQRIYRMRCVEAWSMVIPWDGVPLGEVLKRFEPTSKAKFVEFTSINAPDKLPGQGDARFPWPYVEGLRLDEAMHPLALLTIGEYGEALLPQSGAPVRVVLPWKYGFKSAKSIVRIKFTETQPRNTWQVIAPNEYGFYANVNPEVDHPRWSQATERRIGEFMRRKTLPFNGYAEQVASLYSGMDPRTLF